MLRPIKPSIGVAMHIQCEGGRGGTEPHGDDGERPAYPPSQDHPFPVIRAGWLYRCRRWFDRAKTSSPPPAASGQASIDSVLIAMVALSAATEARLRAACRDVEAMGLKCRLALRQWNGQHADVVIAEGEDVFGRLVCRLATESRPAVLVKAGACSAVRCGRDAGFRQWSHADLAGLIADLCADVLARRSASGTVAEAGVPWLPRTSLLSHAIQHDAVLKDDAGWVSLALGRDHLRIHRMSSRIQAASSRHLEVAGQHVLDPAWHRLAVDRPLAAKATETSLDLFLLRACLERQTALPGLDGIHFRLAHWPDLGGEEPRHAWVLSLMAAVVRQAPVGLEALSRSMAVRHERANAMFWAFWASGVLEVEGAAHPGEKGARAGCLSR